MSLDNPSAIWDHMLTKQIPKCVFYLTYLVSLNNGSISENTLHECYNNFLEEIGFDRTRNDYFEFNDCTKHAVKSTLQRKLEDGKDPIYDVLNPSISDYLIEKIGDNLSFIPSFFSALTTMQSLYNLNTLINKKLPTYLSSKIVNALLNNIHKYKNEDYIIEFVSTVISSPKIPHRDKENSVKIINPDHFKFERFYAGNNYKVLGIVNWITLNSPDWLGCNNIKNYVECSLLANNDDLDYEDLNILAQITNTLGESSMSAKIHDLLLDYWHGYAHEFISDNNDFSEYYDFRDEGVLLSRAKDYINDLLSESTLTFNTQEVENIIVNIDAYNIIERNIESAPTWDEDDHYDNHSYIDNGFNEVDDLFSRE